MTKKKASSRRRSLADELREAIRESGMSMYAIAKEIDHTMDVVTRFMDGRDSRISTVEKMADAIGYRIVLEPKE